MNCVNCHVANSLLVNPLVSVTFASGFLFGGCPGAQPFSFTQKAIRFPEWLLSKGVGGCRLLLGCFGCFATFVFVELAFAHAEEVRCGFDEFVGGDVFDRAL